MLSRPHPVFGDWCYCQPGDSQRLLDRQLAFRDAALKEDPEFSGMPPEFEQWCKTSWLPANLGRDYYRRQAEAHIQDLANKISRLQKEIEARKNSVCSRYSESWCDRKIESVYDLKKSANIKMQKLTDYVFVVASK